MTVKVTETLIRHAQAVYHALEQQSEPEEIQGRTLTVFRGTLTSLYDELGISRSYYSPIVSLLTENNCILFVQRGSRATESVIVLQQEPSAEGMTLPPLTGRAHGAMVDSRLDDLEQRLGGISIVEALDNHEKRLLALETKAAARGGKGSGKKS